MNMSDMFLHIRFLFELGLTFRYFTVNILVFMEIFDMVGKTGLFEKLGRATDFAKNRILVCRLLFLNILIIVADQGFHIIVTFWFGFLFFPIQHSSGCIQTKLFDLCLVFEQELFMPDGDCLEIKKGQENAIAGRADVVWEKSGVLQARLQVQRCLDRLCQGWVLQNILSPKINF